MPALESKTHRAVNWPPRKSQAARTAPPIVAATHHEARALAIEVGDARQEAIRPVADPVVAAVSPPRPPSRRDRPAIRVVGDRRSRCAPVRPSKDGEELRAGQDPPRLARST